MRPRPCSYLHPTVSTSSWAVVAICLVLLFCRRAEAGPILNVAASINLGNQRVALASGPIDLVVMNDGDMPLRLSGLTFSGTNAADFALASMFPIDVPAGGSNPVRFTFKPGALGPRAATATLTSNDPMRPSAMILLSGTGVAPILDVTPKTLTFPRTRTATCSAPQLVKVSNTGTDSLAVGAVLFEGAGAASFRSTSRPETVIPGAAKFVDVAFCPKGTGMQSADLAIPTDLMPGHKATVSLSGTAFGPVLEISPKTIDFGTVYAGTTSTPVTVTLKNTGDDATEIDNITLVGMDTGHFSGMFPAAKSKVPAMGTLTFSVSAKPGDAMPRKAEVLVTLAEELAPPPGPAKELRVALSAVGSVATAEYAPKTLVCGAQFVGISGPCQSELTLRNTGMAPLEGIAVVPSTSEFRVDQVPSMLAPGGTARMPVSFRPLSAGARMGTLSIRAKGLLGTNNVAVSGTGQSVSYTLSPPELDFGKVEIGTPPKPKVITLANEGSVPLAIDLAIDPLADPPEVAMEFVPTPQTFELPPGEVQQISVAYVPVLSGDRTVSLQLLFAGSMVPIDSVEVRAKTVKKPEDMPMGCSLAKIQTSGLPRNPPLQWALSAVALLAYGIVRSGIRRKRRE